MNERSDRPQPVVVTHSKPGSGEKVKQADGHPQEDDAPRRKTKRRVKRSPAQGGDMRWYVRVGYYHVCR